MTVGEVREKLEKSKNPVYIVEGPDKRFRTYMPAWKSNKWSELPDDLKNVFSEFSDRPNFIDCLYEIILDSDDNEDIESFQTKIFLFEKNCNSTDWYRPDEKIYFYSAELDNFWGRQPLRIINNKSIKELGIKEEGLIASSKLNEWLKFHPCQRVYMDSMNELCVKFDLNNEEKKALSKCETIELFNEEKE